MIDVAFIGAGVIVRDRPPGGVRNRLLNEGRWSARISSIFE